MIGVWVEYAARATNDAVCRLEKGDIERLVAAIRSRYGSLTNNSEYLWEDFQDDVSVRREDGWKIACDYVVERPILFFWDGTEYVGYRMTSSEALCRILAESPGFEFFVTDDEVDFVLCFNHHDYLIGVGKCKEWLLGSQEVD